MIDHTSDLPIPGSVQLVQVGPGHVEGGKGGHHVAQAADIVLHPRPSSDVNDPLNWTKRRKRLATFCLVIYTLAAGMGTTALYSVLTPISAGTNISLGGLNAGTGYMFLLLGWGALVNQPLAMTFGKRPMYLFSLLGNMAMCIWMPYITSEGEWLVNKVLQGFFVSPIESLIEISITDLYFAHERGFYIGLYALSLFGSNYLAPLLAGFINDGQGWHWVMYWSAIWNAGAFLMLLFLMEETNYSRPPPEVDSTPSSRSDTAAEFEPSSAPTHESEVVAGEKKDVIRSHEAPATAPADISLGHYQSSSYRLDGEPTPYLMRLRMFNQRWTSIRVLGILIYRPLLFLRFPVVVWAGFAYGSGLTWYAVLNATASLILTDVPYNFRSSFVGLMYASALIGAACSTAYAGYFGDRFMLWFAGRKGGVREPEDRLWLMSITLILCPVGLILWGVGASAGIHWIGLAVGMGMSAASTGVITVLALGYALDAYKDLDGEVMVTVMIIRNTIAFAIGYAITPWLELGLRNTFISAAMIGLVVNLSFLIVIKWGKSWRSSSRDVYWRYVKNSAIQWE